MKATNLGALLDISFIEFLFRNVRIASTSAIRMMQTRFEFLKSMFEMVRTEPLVKGWPNFLGQDGKQISSLKPEMQ